MIHGGMGYVEHPYGTELSEAVMEWQKINGERYAFVLVAEGDKAAIPALQQVFSRQGIPMCGAMFPGLIVDGQVVYKGVLLIALPEDTVAYLSRPLDEQEAVADFLRWLDRQRIRQRTLFLIFDALLPNIATELELIYAELGMRYLYAGVNAGSNKLRQEPCLFNNTLFESGRMLAVMLHGSTGGMLEHGYPEPEDACIATSSDGNLIRTLDWRPAFSGYRDLVYKNYQVTISKKNFYKYSVHFPFGIVRANGELLVRIPSDFNNEGGIFCIGEVPPNSILKVLDGPADILFQGVRRLADRLCAQVRAESLLFYCVGRGMHLGIDGLQRELDLLNSAAGPCFGALSLGEIGTTGHDQYPLFHNAAVEAVQFSDES